ncbi:uncharacterized protein LAJ45_01915 [Morchella importuna]|uniref:Fe2OG dioxygenase domain-containing protein n=1 Tax=Morchella conica CCBAS932 TaxID=1392247 RepID=A0A3N4L223_9PEZI|nr:uncharacterized protein LAJ45_01915 [Morchella importuna]KAH8154147.1 hypothetical protein LAJ45_01915 [Morchella importuna]RPB16873.1 hypothetical protein P167DRAFT_561844 [Morchella conica CCBAS932]
MDAQTLKTDLLSTPTAPAGAHAERIDFSTTPLAKSYGKQLSYALVIDDLFTPDECRKMLQFAALTGGGWKEALINSGYSQVLRKDIRDCTRVMIDDFELAGLIFGRVKPYLDEVVEVGKGTEWDIASYAGKYYKWKMTRLNERLRFLRYTKDQYFKPHGDGSYATPDDKERSFLTLHLYLNSSGDTEGGVKGGSTRFLPYNYLSQSLDRDSECLDIEPKVGRVLIFQHQGLIHSGEPVTAGTKYTMRTDIMYERMLPTLEDMQ